MIQTIAKWNHGGMDAGIFFGGGFSFFFFAKLVYNPYN